MAKELVLLSGLITGLAAVIAVVMAGLGMYAVIAGRCKLCEDLLRGRTARIAGLAMLAPLVLGLATLPIFQPTLGVYNEAARIAMPVLAVISLTLGIGYALKQRDQASLA